MVFDVVGREFSKLDKYFSALSKGFENAQFSSELNEKALKQSGLTEAVYKYITSLGVSSAAEMTFAQKLKLSTIALKEQAVAFIASPLGKAAIIAAAIFAIVKVIDYFTSAEERAAEELANLESEFEELQDKINSASNEFRSLKSSADTIIPRFAELSKGVDALGNNVSLTDDEYAEFLSLNNQIADMFPELNMGLDSNGNAMLSLSYTADTLADSLWNLVDAERAAANQTIADTMPTVIKNITNSVGIYRDKIADLSDTQAEYFDIYSDFLNRSLKTNIGRYSTLESGKAAAEEFIAIAKELGIQGSVLVDNQSATNNGYVFSVEWDYSPLDHPLLLEDIESQFKTAIQKYNKLIGDLQSKIEAKWAQLNPVVSSWMQTDFMFQDLNDVMQEIALTMVSGLDFSALGLKTQQQVQDYVTQNILDPLFTATPEVESAFEAIADWKQLLKNGDISFEQFSDYVTNAFDGLLESMDPTAIEKFKTAFVNAFNQIGISGDSFETVLAGLISEWGTVSTVTNEATDATEVFASVNEKLSGSKENIDSIADAMSKLSNGSLEVWDVVELIEKFPTLAEYVDFTADNFGRLGEGLKKLAHSELESFIDSMEQFKETSNLTDEQVGYIDALCDSLRNLTADSVQNLSGEFGVLAESINAATKAQNELEKALAEDDYDAGYESRVDAFEGFQEVIGAGEFGSKAYAAYKEYFGLAGKTHDEVEAWMADNERYFTEGTDGLVAFMGKVEALSESGELDGIASFDSESGEFWYDINELGAFADVLGWTEEMLQDFIDKYRMYCEEWESRSPAETLKEFTEAGYITSMGDGKTMAGYLQGTGEWVDFSPTYASLEKLKEYTGLGEEGVYDLIDSINELRAQKGLPNIQLIGRDITEVTRFTVASWQQAGATAEDIVAFIMDLAAQGVEIEPNLNFVLDDGTYVDIDKMLAEAGYEGTETVSVQVQFSTNAGDVSVSVEAMAKEVTEILGDGWEVLLNSEDAETRIGAVSKLLEGLPQSTDCWISDNANGTISRLTDVSELLATIDKNSQKTVYIHYKIEDVPAFAKGTSGAKTGPALLGDEYSPDGSPKPELVVSNGRAYIAGQNGPEIGYLNEGDIVYTADETKQILRGNVLHNSIPAHAGGTTDWAGLSSGKYNTSNTGSDSSSSSNSSSSSDDESWFERQYKDHNHWLEMDKESVSDYLEWLDDAYKQAYEEGTIDLDDYYKYEEEVYQKTQDLFKDYLNDIDHEISMLEAGVGNSDEIINLSLQAIQKIEKELAAARAAGLDENGDYIQYLEQQWLNYYQTVTDLREDAESSAQNSIDELVEYRIKMLKQDIENQKDALNEKLDDLQDFYDKQREMLQDQYDEEKYLEEQSEKRKSVTDIQSELAMLEHDDSAWAQKRKLELKAELADAQKELDDFEKDYALDAAIDMLDEQQAAQEALIQAEIDALDEKLNDPHALFNQALEDIKNNTAELYQEFIEYNRKYGTGNDADIADIWEEAYKADLEYQDTHDGEHLDGIAIGNYTGYVVPTTPQPSQPGTEAEPTSSSEPETTTASNTPEVTDEIKKKVAAAIWNGGYGWGNGADRINRLTEVFGANNGIQDLVNKGVGKSGVSLTSEYTYANMRKKFKGYASGTDNATPGWHRLFEGDLDEYVFASSDGNKYRMFSGLGEKVLNGAATDFLYDFANSGGTVLTKMLADLFGQTAFSNIDKPVQAIEIHSGDIIVQGNASERTVSEIRRAQRDNLKFVITEFNKLNK